MDYRTADRLVELRKRNGYSQEELADKLGVSRQAISNWERAEALPDTENLIALARLYRITLDEVIHGDNPSAATSVRPKTKPIQGNNMKPVRSAFKLVSLVHFVVGLPLLTVAIVLFGLSFAFEGDAELALIISGASIAFSGLVEVIIGASFCAVTRGQTKKLARLKNSGTKIQVDSIELKRTLAFRTMRTTSARLECTYTHQGKIRTTLSPMFLVNMNETSPYNAFVYMNPQDSSDFAVEVLCQA